MSTAVDKMNEAIASFEREGVSQSNLKELHPVIKAMQAAIQEISSGSRGILSNPDILQNPNILEG